VITQNSIQQIQSRLDIIEVIGSFVKLKKRGANYLGNCPFHNERTPSFTVSPSKEIYKCFGCGKSGNTVSFIMEHEKFSYVETLRWLANRYNIEIEETETSSEQKQLQHTAESLHIINAFAQQFYSQQLLETEDGADNGLSYLEERGFSNDIIKKFELGYAPDKKDALSKEAIAKQYNKELLQKAGLVVERNGQLQDNYRDRIIFPIHNNTGKVIGFGARLIKKNDKAPKYINTPENELYVKSKLLYGSYFARQAIDKAAECFLVEGYTDVLSLHQAGIENVVASGGTSLTQDQLRLIKKYTSNLTIIYDGDTAGVKAALRGLDMALEESLNVKLVLIPDGEDPDSYVRKVGEKGFRKFVDENKKDFIFFQVDVLLKDVGTDQNKKADVVNQIAETISKIDKTEDFTKQQDYIRQCAQTLKIDETGFTALVNKFIRNRLSSDKKLPFTEAKHYEENAKKGEVTDYDDNTFTLLFKDELQEREVARVLLELGNKPWEDGRLTADYIFSELPEDDLIENEVVLNILHEYKSRMQQKQPIDKNFFIYHPNNTLSSFAVSLMQFQYEQSPRWKKDMSQSTGYQQSLFKQDYKIFLRTLDRSNSSDLEQYLKIGEDKSSEEVISAITYLKLKKIKKLIMQNAADMEKALPAEQMNLFLTHQHLKGLEMELTSKLGSVIVK
jgi:DNA primase